MKIKNYLKKIFLSEKNTNNHEDNYSVVDVLMNKHGYKKTNETKIPLSAEGFAIPWYTYPAIEYLNQLDAKGLKVFEYGCGNSSLYWARKGANVWAVEHDKNWYEKMRESSSQLRGIVHHNTIQLYSKAIEEVGEKFDIIVVDGVWRMECAKNVVNNLKPGGICILDNSDWYTDVSEYFKRNNFFQVDFNGFGPINNYSWTTSILFNLNSPVALNFSNPNPIGGIQVSRSEMW